MKNEVIKKLNLKKYLAIFKYSFKANMTFILNYFISLISFTVHILVFNSMWDFILKDGSLFGYTKNELIWYIIIAEFITYSVITFYKKISDMVKDGTVANLLIKPINFLAYIIAEQSAEGIKIIINAITAIVLGNVFAGSLLVSAESLFFFVIAVILSLIIATCIQMILGLVAFYIEETKSIWFIVQKAQFLLVFVPIEFYGKLVQKLLMFLPTTHMIYTPATILIKYDFNTCIALIAMQIITIIVLAMTTCILYKKGVRKINVNGG